MGDADILILPEGVPDDAIKPPSIVFGDVKTTSTCDPSSYADFAAAVEIATHVAGPSPPDSWSSESTETVSDAESADGTPSVEVALGGLNLTIVDAILSSPSIEKLRGAVTTQRRQRTYTTHYIAVCRAFACGGHGFYTPCP